jgi:hypothetical protein
MKATLDKDNGGTFREESFIQYLIQNETMRQTSAKELR